MTLTELKYIVSVEREMHFGLAAKACLVSQPTLSVAIQKLEAELEIKIFERSSSVSGVVITPFGHIIIAQAKKILQEAENLKELASRMNAIDKPTPAAG